MDAIEKLDNFDERLKIDLMENDKIGENLGNTKSETTKDNKKEEVKGIDL